MAMFFALGAILLWSTLALLGLKLNSLPPFLLLAGAFILGGLPQPVESQSLADLLANLPGWDRRNIRLSLSVFSCLCHRTCR